MFKSHDELIEGLSKLLMAQNYKPVVVTNHRLHVRQFLDNVAERVMLVAPVTTSQVDQDFRDAAHCFQLRYGRSPSSRWHGVPRKAICKFFRLAHGNGRLPPKSCRMGHARVRSAMSTKSGCATSVAWRLKQSTCGSGRRGAFWTGIPIAMVPVISQHGHA
jgi:hypothetical protein